MTEYGPAPSHPEYRNPDEYLSERDLIQRRVIALKQDVEELGALGAEAESRIGPDERQMVLREMDIFRKVYFAHMFEINNLFERLGWNVPPADELINPGIPSERIVDSTTIVEFNPPFNIAHEFMSKGVNESIVYQSGSTDLDKGAYGIDIEVGRDGQFTSHPATEDEIAALQELVNLLEPEYRVAYQTILQKEDRGE